ncbi:MAG: InlB B-repeat-containing protein [Candidatus Micrarchaeia archaeon]
MLIKKVKSQSAIDFLITYSFALFIITVILSILFVFLNLPKTVFPTECKFYGNFDCIGASLIQQSNGISAVAILATDSMPGVVNSISFNAIINNHKSISGSCSPSYIKDGQYTYCIAYFNTILINKNLYSVFYNVSANYCPYGANETCPANGNYLIAGMMEAMPSTQNTITYPLIVTALPGGIVTPQGISMQQAGSYVSITAIPDSGYTFVNWTCIGAGCYSGISNPATVVVNNLVTETATFRSS